MKAKKKEPTLRERQKILGKKRYEYWLTPSQKSGVDAFLHEWKESYLSSCPHSDILPAIPGYTDRAFCHQCNAIVAK